MGTERISKQKMFVSLHSFTLFAFITGKWCVYCAVRCDCLTVCIIQGNVIMWRVSERIGEEVGDINRDLVLVMRNHL
jgi:hypothetical protein